MQCPRCHTENRPGRRFCAECAAPLAAPCPACGFANEPGEKFCGGCAAPLTAESRQAEPRFAAPDAYTVAYGSLLQDRRRALHARAVEGIEGLHPERLAEHAERLAHHALRGEVWEKAVHYLRQAAGKAMDRSAYREALAGLEQALARSGTFRRIAVGRNWRSISTSTPAVRCCRQARGWSASTTLTRPRCVPRLSGTSAAWGGRSSFARATSGPQAIPTAPSK
jgi:hypothetical protein